ncbi:GlxA family transcriptional regulator [Pandoraea anhela]|uniref:GlxA family transcriptional regulator n=1 Tax=Pandoraea anhela TaxID=2508295 RepID=UPI001FE8D2F4|nr:helix-turn-helix domain-containing protein [Pandoraea anhela]
MSGESVRTSNGLLVETGRLDPRTKYGLVFIPSFHYSGRADFEKLLKTQTTLRSWLTSQWNNGAWVAANCTGTFILAETGLLDGRVATTTWWLQRQFRSRFPRVDLQLDPVVTEADRLVCAGAYASYLLQAIRVIERFSGPVIASLSAKTMLIDVSQTTQTPHLPLLSDKSHGDSMVHKAQHRLQKHMARDLRIVDLAAELNVSERTLIRRFKAALDQTPLSYLQSLRLDAARSLLEAGDLTVEGVAQRVGYADTSSFSRLFREKIGLSPGAYRMRFRTSS